MNNVYMVLKSFLRGRWDDRGVSPEFRRVSGGRKLAEADFGDFFETSNLSKARDKGRKRTSQEKRQDLGRKYRENKKHAKAFTPILLREVCADGDKHAAWFEAQGFKRDDLADAILQAYYAGKPFLTAGKKTGGIRGLKLKASSKPAHKKKQTRDAFASEVDDAMFGDMFSEEELESKRLGPFLKKLRVGAVAAGKPGGD